MELRPGLVIADSDLAAFCRRHGVRRLALYGSALGNDFRRDSDVDVLVEFEPGRTPGLLAIAAMELELGRLIGREVELRTYEDLSRYFRDEVRASARELYAAACHGQRLLGCVTGWSTTTSTSTWTSSGRQSRRTSLNC